MRKAACIPQRAACLHLGSQKRSLRLIDRRLKAKAPVNDLDVVVNGLGHPNDTGLQILYPALIMYGIRCCIASCTHGWLLSSCLRLMLKYHTPGRHSCKTSQHIVCGLVLM